MRTSWSNCLTIEILAALRLACRSTTDQCWIDRVNRLVGAPNDWMGMCDYTKGVGCCCIRFLSLYLKRIRRKPVCQLEFPFLCTLVFHWLLNGLHTNWWIWPLPHQRHSVATAHCRHHPAESSATFAHHHKSLQLPSFATGRPQSAASNLMYN